MIRLQYWRKIHGSLLSLDVCIEERQITNEIQRRRHRHNVTLSTRIKISREKIIYYTIVVRVK